MPQLTLHLLGSPRLELNDIPLVINRRKVLALLVYLALTQHTHRRDHLANLFWPGYDQSSARGNLRRALSTLNRTLTGNWLQIDREQVRLKQDNNFWLDVDQFHQLLTSCNTHSHPNNDVCTDCLEALSQAVALYQDDLLTGFTLPGSPRFDDWQLFQTENLRRELAEALEKLVRGHSAQNEFEPALTFTRRWLALDPLQESAHRHLMLLLTLNEQRNAALIQYENCRQILADELGVEPTTETTKLYEQIHAGGLSNRAEEQESKGVIFSASSQSSLLAAGRHNLPIQLTPFIGRKEEVTEITRLICDEPACRLLTLVGPGGIGKTRLALQVATQAIDTFPDGVFFVSLAPIDTAVSLIPAIADALNLPLSGGKPKERLLNSLRQKKMLLLLDNFEQLIPAGGTELLLEIIMAAPTIKLLVTSRERLRLQPEWGVEVRGLHFPKLAPSREKDWAEVAACDAMQLFLQQARRAQPGFMLSSANRSDAIRICRMMEGTPLGLELSAAWLRMMSCQEIAQEIERSLDFLTTSLRDVPARHHSLRAIFEYSWRLLSEKEKALFRKLAVFSGGFHRRAAERVAGASLPLLSMLMDKSLLRCTRAGRFEVHELLRQFAAEKLTAIPEESEQVQDRHSDYYLTFLQQGAEELKGSGEQNALDAISLDIGNVRAAWRGAIARKNLAALGRSADGLLLFSDYRGWFQQGAAAIHQAMRCLPLELREAKSNENIAQFDFVLARLLRAEGWFSVRLGNIAHGQKLLQESVSLLCQAEPESEEDLALSLHWLSHTYWFQGKYPETKQFAQESLAIFTELGNRWGMGITLYMVGLVAGYQGEYQEANRRFKEGISHLEKMGELRWKTLCLTFSGVVARLCGDYPRARQYYTESLQIKRDFGDLIGTGYILRELGYLAIATGDYPQAKEWMQESATIFREIDTRYALVFPLDGLGTIARLQGDYQQAEQLHQESLTMCREFEERRGIALCLSNLGLLAYGLQDYPQAEQLLQESLTRYEQIGHRQGMASVLCHLGYVTCASGSARNEEVRRQLHQSSEIALKIGARPVALNTLVGWAMWLSADAPVDAAQERAIELLTLVLHHPASEQETKDRATQLFDELKSNLPPESVAAAQERGKAKMLNTVLMELLEIHA